MESLDDWAKRIGMEGLFDCDDWMPLEYWLGLYIEEWNGMEQTLTMDFGE